MWHRRDGTQRRGIDQRVMRRLPVWSVGELKLINKPKGHPVWRSRARSRHSCNRVNCGALRQMTGTVSPTTRERCACCARSHRLVFTRLRRRRRRAGIAASIPAADLSTQLPFGYLRRWGHCSSYGSACIAPLRECARYEDFCGSQLTNPARKDHRIGARVNDAI
jgi:hypothetical protein